MTSFSPFNTTISLQKSVTVSQGEVHPITFSIPKEKICNTRNIKRKILSSLIPGNTKTYIYNTEEDYYNEYKQSYFAITMKKGGWDCMRHYEILANGCVPYFSTIQECPPNTMALLPKELLIQANTLYETKFHNKTLDQLTETDINEYTILQQKLLEYTKKHLTTDKIAKYILQKSKCIHGSKILYLSGDTSPDYLRCITLHGFKTLFGSNCHDYPKIPHIYKSNDIHYNGLYGKGISYTNLLEQHLHDGQLDSTMYEDIKNKKYDIVIYGSYHRGMPFYDIVCEIYKPDEIILLCGEDLHHCNYTHFVNKGHHVFVREL
jgi:hypothetical protein